MHKSIENPNVHLTKNSLTKIFLNLYPYFSHSALPFIFFFSKFLSSKAASIFSLNCCRRLQVSRKRKSPKTLWGSDWKTFIFNFKKLSAHKSPLTVFDFLQWNFYVIKTPRRIVYRFELQNCGIFASSDPIRAEEECLQLDSASFFSLLGENLSSKIIH